LVYLKIGFDTENKYELSQDGWVVFRKRVLYVCLVTSLHVKHIQLKVFVLCNIKGVFINLVFKPKDKVTRHDALEYVIRYI